MSEHDLQEVPSEPADAGDRLQESVVGDVAASVAALTGTGTFAYAAATFHRGQSRAALQAEHDAEMDELRRQHDLELRYLRAQLYGLEALDAMDRGDYYSPGFGVDDEPFYGFGVE